MEAGPFSFLSNSLHQFPRSFPVASALPSLSLFPFHFLPLPYRSPPCLRTRTPKFQLGGLGERCELTSGSGRYPPASGAVLGFLEWERFGRGGWYVSSPLEICINLNGSTRIGHIIVITVDSNIGFTSN